MGPFPDYWDFGMEDVMGPFPDYGDFGRRYGAQPVDDRVWLVAEVPRVRGQKYLGKWSLRNATKSLSITRCFTYRVLPFKSTNNLNMRLRGPELDPNY